jgi:hypothetical protein
MSFELLVVRFAFAFGGTVGRPKLQPPQRQRVTRNSPRPTYCTSLSRCEELCSLELTPNGTD